MLPSSALFTVDSLPLKVSIYKEISTIPSKLKWELYKEEQMLLKSAD
jgi:hypothetical protein